MEELNITPSLDFERLVCDDFKNFVYTAENMTKLKEMRDDLKLQVEDAKQQADEKREELRAIWSYLDEPELFCEKFIREHQGHSVTTLKAVSFKNVT